MRFLLLIIKLAKIKPNSLVIITIIIIPIQLIALHKNSQNITIMLLILHFMQQNILQHVYTPKCVLLQSLRKSFGLVEP